MFLKHIDFSPSIQANDHSDKKNQLFMFTYRLRQFLFTSPKTSEVGATKSRKVLERKCAPTANDRALVHLARTRVRGRWGDSKRIAPGLEPLLQVLCEIVVAHFAWFGTLIVLFPQLASANITQDMLGTSPRVNAIGGAGTALATDFSAVYYNPANLTRCVGGSLTLMYDHVQYGLEIEDSPTEPTPPDYPEPESMTPHNQWTFGACAHLPFGLSFGFLLTQGLGSMGIMEQSTTDEIPRFILYGQRFESPSTMLGLALRIGDRLSIGLGQSLIMRTEVSARVKLALLPPTDTEVETPFGYSTNVAPKIAIYAGIQYSPIDSINLGITFRSSLFFEVSADLPMTIETGDVSSVALVDAEGVVAYSPAQVALGATYELTETWLLAADLTWYHWSDYSGPFLQIEKEIPPELQGLLGLEPPEAESPNFVDVLVPRIGAEYRFEQRWSLRGGYAYRPTPAPLPEYRANILDGDTNSISIGGGYLHVLSSTEKPEDYQTSISFDIYTVLSYLFEQEVSKNEPQKYYNSYNFGGWIFTAGMGVTLTL